MECAVRVPGGGANERGDGVVALSKPDANFGPAFTLALLHETAQAHKIGDRSLKSYPDYTSAQFSYLPALRALEALERGEPVKASKSRKPPFHTNLPFRVRHLSATASSELFIPSTCAASLIPEWVGISMQREFQKLLDHPGLSAEHPIGPFTRLELARALSGSGDRARSAAVYKDLLMIWKDADAELPIVQSESRISRLQ